MITGEKQKLNKQMVEFKNFHTFSILYARFGQHFSKVLKTDFTIQYFFNTAWEP